MQSVFRPFTLRECPLHPSWEGLVTRVMSPFIKTILPMPWDVAIVAPHIPAGVGRHTENQLPHLFPFWTTMDSCPHHPYVKEKYNQQLFPETVPKTSSYPVESTVASSPPQIYLISKLKKKTRKRKGWPGISPQPLQNSFPECRARNSRQTGHDKRTDLHSKRLQESVQKLRAEKKHSLCSMQSSSVNQKNLQPAHSGQETAKLLLPSIHTSLPLP